MAAPLKLTKEIIQRITTAIRLCATYELAALYGGVSYSHYRTWMVRGEKEETGIYRELSDAVKKAEGESVVALLAKIEKAANDGIWTAAAWKIERRYPQMYGKQALELSGTVKVDGFKELADAFREKVDTAAKRLKNEEES